MRLDLIMHLRDQIERGTYVTRGKLEAVCDRLLAELRASTDEADEDSLRSQEERDQRDVRWLRPDGP